MGLEIFPNKLCMYSEIQEYKITTCDVVLTHSTDSEDEVNYVGRPVGYPMKSQYIDVRPERWVAFFTRLINHNKNIRFNFLGNSLDYAGICDVLEYLNYNSANYSFDVYGDFYDKIEKIRCYDEYASISQVNVPIEADFKSVLSDSLSPKHNNFTKTWNSLKTLVSSEICGTVVAKIRVTSNNIFGLPETVEMLAKDGIYSDIVFCDVQKTNMYDAETKTISTELVHNDINTQMVVDKVMLNSAYVVNSNSFRRYCLMLPSEMECVVYSNMRAISVDSDFKLRLCDRIRGTNCTNFDPLRLIEQDGSISMEFVDLVKKDYESHCAGCNCKNVFVSQTTQA